MAIITRGEEVLLARETTDDFWYLPGGRVHPGEPSPQALSRVVRDELGESARIGDLLCVLENFFTHAETRFHEIGLYFDVVLEPGSDVLSWTVPTSRDSSRGIPHEFVWHPIARLSGLDVRPPSLPAHLPFQRSRTAHIIDERFADGLALPTTKSPS